MMFATSGDLQKNLRWPVGNVVLIVVAKDLQSLIAGTQQTGTQKKHPLRTRVRLVGKLLKRVGAAIVVAVDQDANITRPGNHDPAFGIERHGMHVVSQIIIGKQFDVKPRWHFDAIDDDRRICDGSNGRRDRPFVSRQCAGESAPQ